MQFGLDGQPKNHSRGRILKLIHMRKVSGSKHTKVVPSPLFLPPCIFTLLLLIAPSPAAHAQAAKPQAPKPRIAVFAGPNGTTERSEPFVTGDKARSKYGLPLQKDRAGHPLRFDGLRPQRLAAPVKVYIEAFSAHPLEKDMAELYAPPDGYLDAKTRAFSKQRQKPDDIPVYEATLDPADGLYMLPYMARQADGRAWDDNCTHLGAPLEECRLMFYPDPSRVFEEIDRFGLSGPLAGPWVVGQLNSKADFDFYRAAPPAGYRKGLPASERTDVGEGDIPKEKWGVDFFPYGPGNQRQEPPMQTLARLTNVVQHAMGSGKYAGGIWLGGSPTTEESIYWLDLLIDTTLPISGNASMSPHQSLENDGDANIINSVDYIVSGIWKDANGKDKIGAVMTQEKRVITAREVQKTAARPGAYQPEGGLGGFVASVDPTILTFIPNRKHTWTSDVNTTRLPTSVHGVHMAGNQITSVEVPIKDAKGDLLGSAIPSVRIVKYAQYEPANFGDDTSGEVEIAARIEKNLQAFPLSGFILEGNAPFGDADPPLVNALNLAALRGMPVVRVGRGNNEGFSGGGPSETRLQINGGNLTSTKARLLLMASLMKLGSLPIPANPNHPTKDELHAIAAKLQQYQEIFSTH